MARCLRELRDGRRPRWGTLSSCARPRPRGFGDYGTDAGDFTRVPIALALAALVASPALGKTWTEPVPVGSWPIDIVTLDPNRAVCCTDHVVTLVAVIRDSLGIGEVA